MGLLDSLFKENDKSEKSHNIDNNVFVDTYRGNVVENKHRGIVAVADSKGKILYSNGNIKQMVFMRSACKLLQVIPIFENKVVETLNLTDEEIALACSSHSGENNQIAILKKWLDRIGFSEEDLELGAVEPLNKDVAETIKNSGKPLRKLYNPCSGLHVSLLSICSILNINPDGYIKSTHPVQRFVASSLSYFSGLDIKSLETAVDGCGMPAYAMPFETAVKSLANFVDFSKHKSNKADYIKSIITACRESNLMLSGTNRFDSELMKVAPNLISKAGADGVQAVYIPEQKLAVLIKIESGDYKSAHITTTEVLHKLNFIDDIAYNYLKKWCDVPILDSNGSIVGKSIINQDFQLELKEKTL